MREDGIGSDAGRPSLTEVGGATARAFPGATCRLCGITCAPGAKFCPNCGAIQRPAATAIDSRAHASGPLPPLPPARLARDPASPPPAADPASVPHAAVEPSPRLATPRVRPAARGERLVAWSALGVLMIATVLVVQRLGDLRSAPGAAAAERTIAQLPPVETLPIPGRSEATAPGEPAPAFAPAVSPARETIAAARHAAKPAPKSKAHASRKPPTRAASRSASSARVATPDAAPLPPPARPEPILVAAAPPTPDARTRWDSMHDEITTCKSRGLLEGAVCQQRVRLRYCDGWWGRKGECPAARDDYGN